MRARARAPHLLLGNEDGGVPDRRRAGVEVSAVEPNHHRPSLVRAVVTYAHELFLNRSHVHLEALAERI